MKEAQITKNQQMQNLLRLERIMTFILRIHPDFPWLQKRTQQELVFIRILVQRSLEQDLQSTDDQCVPGQLPFYNRVCQPNLIKWGKVNGVDMQLVPT